MFRNIIKNLSFSSVSLHLLSGGVSIPLTTGLPLLVKQDAIYGGPDKNISATLLDDRDHVKGKLAGTTTGIVCTTLVVVKKQRVYKEAGLFWRDT